MLERYDGNYWRDDLSQQEAAHYIEPVREAILKERMDGEEQRGLMTYYHETDSVNDKVQSLLVDVEVVGGRLWGVATLKLTEPLTPEETSTLKDYLTGQYSDGFGEGFEQREIKTGNGELYVSLWSHEDSFFIDTQREFSRRLGLETPRHEAAAICKNGELRPGDTVLSTADNDYACLVGTVLSITEPDRIRVNFMDAAYSENRLQEIEQMLGDLYGRPTTPGIWPPVDIDDVAMTQDTLFRITGIGHEELTKILSSGENAAAFVKKLESGLHETPAKAALAEPDIYDSAGAAALREQLIARLDDNFAGYFNSIRYRDGQEVTDMTSEIGAAADAHFYLTEIHNFHTSELEYLLRFQNPLAVVADQFQVSGIDGRSDIMWEIFDRQDALSGDYALAPVPADEDKLRQTLDGKLDRNFADALESFRTAMADPETSDSDLIRMTGQVISLDEAKGFLKEDYDFRDGELAILASLDCPLDSVAKDWPYISTYIDTHEGMHEYFDNGDYDHDKPLIATAAKEAPREIPAEKTSGEKQSVMGRIRDSVNAPKEPPKDKQPRDKPGPER